MHILDKSHIQKSRKNLSEATVVCQTDGRAVSGAGAGAGAGAHQSELARPQSSPNMIRELALTAS